MGSGTWPESSEVTLQVTRSGKGGQGTNIAEGGGWGDSRTPRRKKSEGMQENRGKSLVVRQERGAEPERTLELTRLFRQVSNVTGPQKNRGIYF